MPECYHFLCSQVYMATYFNLQRFITEACFLVNEKSFIKMDNVIVISLKST